MNGILRAGSDHSGFSERFQCADFALQSEKRGPAAAERDETEAEERHGQHRESAAEQESDQRGYTEKDENSEHVCDDEQVVRQRQKICLAGILIGRSRDLRYSPTLKREFPPFCANDWARSPNQPRYNCKKPSNTGTAALVYTLLNNRMPPIADGLSATQFALTTISEMERKIAMQSQQALEVKQTSPSGPVFVEAEKLFEQMKESVKATNIEVKAA